MNRSWLRHRSRRATRCPECGQRGRRLHRHQQFCDVCGYELVRRVKPYSPPPRG